MFAHSQRNEHSLIVMVLIERENTNQKTLKKLICMS